MEPFLVNVCWLGGTFQNYIILVLRNHANLYSLFLETTAGQGSQLTTTAYSAYTHTYNNPTQLDDLVRVFTSAKSKFQCILTIELFNHTFCATLFFWTSKCVSSHHDRWNSVHMNTAIKILLSLSSYYIAFQVRLQIKHPKKITMEISLYWKWDVEKRLCSVSSLWPCWSH